MTYSGAPIEGVRVFAGTGIVLRNTAQQTMLYCTVTKLGR